MIDITTLKPNPRNPRIISKEAMEKLKASIKRDPKFMEINQIKIDDTNTVLGGNQRLEACKALGMKEIPDNWVKRTGDLTDEEKLRYVVIDNSPQGISGEWDYEMLSEDFDIPELESIGIDTDKLSRFIEDKDNETPEDSTPPIPDTPKSKPNTLYQLGEHRLFVGDSTSPDNLKKLMQDKQADLLITDPPYNVNYTGKTADALTIDNDSMDDTKFLEFLTNAFKAADSVMRPGAVFYIWHADSEGFNFRSACKLTGWKVRQCLIWMKNCMVMGRQDYQWRHEPCQPAGTMVRTPTGEVPIESLKDGDSVVSYNSYSGVITGMRDGRTIKVGTRHYNGNLYGVKVGDKQTWTTDTHQFSVRFKDNNKTTFCTYLMRRGNWWRVGITSTYNARGFGLKHRIRQEDADEAWILGTHSSKTEAVCAEQIISVKYGIPQTHWNINRGLKNTAYVQRTTKQIESIYDSLDLNTMHQNAIRLITDFGRRPEHPFCNRETMNQKCSRRVTVKILACNLIPGIMEVPIPYAQWDTDNDKTFDWQPIVNIEHKSHNGPVYSMDVEKDQHYIADGIVTHNCLYGWKDGAAHTWNSDRTQTTILEFNKPSRNPLHPTMKPIELYEYQIRNSTKRNDIILDTFCGSGTAILAAHKSGRVAHACELDPKYADVIRMRYSELVHGKDRDWESLTPEIPS